MISIYFLIFLFGISIGSFLNVVIFRLKNNRSFIKGRSYCPKCKHKLNWVDLIPFFGFFIRKGRCHYCGLNISRQYPLVELATGILFTFTFWFYKDLPAGYFFMIREWIFISVLIVVFVYDLKYQLILDKVTLPAIIFALGYNILLGYPRGSLIDSLINLLLAGAVGGGFFLLQFYISKGRWIGGGDIRLGLLMGFMVGWPLILVALFLAYISGAVISLILIGLKRKKMKSQIPFGVFLAPSAALVIFYGQQILDWYLSKFLFL